MGDNGGMTELLPELLARCRAGDRGAFEVLVRRFHAYAMAVAQSLCPAQCEDAVQSAFVTVLTRLGELREAEAFPGWLRQVVRTECGRLTRGRALLGIQEFQVSTAPGPVEGASREEVREQVRAAVASLPAVQRETVELFYLDELAQADVARTLDVPEGTVKRRLHDARVNLRAKLKSQLPI
jgi:RNA polymerase sigma factor (sigma-70 family)